MSKKYYGASIMDLPSVVESQIRINRLYRELVDLYVGPVICRKIKKIPYLRLVKK